MAPGRGGIPLTDTSEIRHVVACATHIGRTHRKNQDTGGAWTFTRSDGTPASLAVVADGVSAGANSEAASREAVETLRSRLSGPLQFGTGGIDTILPVLIAATEAASESIARQAGPFSASADTTTLAAVAAIGVDAGGVWCGDSRVYRLSRDVAERLTSDHSWAEGVVREGIMTAEQASMDRRAHMITRWLGPQEGGAPVIESFRMTAQAGDILLACSDGLYMYFTPPIAPDGDLASALRRGEGADDLPNRLNDVIAQVLALGGHDDVTGAAIEVDVV